MNRIYWLTGTSGAGKTTLARHIQKSWPCVILDGDEMRDSISLGAGFSREDREEHNLRVARLAKELVKQMNVLVTVIAPMEETRKKISEICSPTWIYVCNKRLEETHREGHFYERPDPFDVPFVIRTDCQSERLSVLGLLEIIKDSDEPRSLLIGRWQTIPIHAGHIALINKVLETRRVLIGIRDTKIGSNDPYTVEERIDGIRQIFPDEDQVKIMVLPDIAEICHGRKVGWGIREIHLDKEIESISATEIRRRKSGK